MPTTLDMMEYATDAAAQAAYASSGSEAVDQSATGTPGYTGNLGNVSGVEYRQGQSFQVQFPARVTSLEVRQTSVAGSPSGNWDLRIETDSGGLPSGSLVTAGATVTVSPPGAGNSVKGTFASPIKLSPSTVYHLVIQCNNQSVGNLWTITRDAATYAYGTVVQSTDGTWAAILGRETWFKVYIQTELDCFSGSSQKVEGSYSLLCAAQATDSLNKTLTRTVTPTINLSGIDCLWLYIYASRTGANIGIELDQASVGTVVAVTPNILAADTWQMVAVNLAYIDDVNKNAIDTIKVTVLNADAANTFYLDCIFADDYPQYLIDRQRSRVRRRAISAGE